MSEQVKPAPKAYQANVFWDRQDCATLSAQVYLASDADSYIDALHTEAEALWSTYIALVDKLGIDTEKAKTADGKPSDVIVSYVEALRAALFGIASVNPAERGIEWAKSYASDGLKGAGSELYARWLDTFNEAEALRAQVSALQSDANSWQSGYDKGREDGAKAAEGWKAQHARDSAELRKLCAERDTLAAELEAIKGQEVDGGK